MYEVQKADNTWTKTYSGRVTCCPLVSHVEYAPRALLRLERRRDRQTNRRTDAIPLHLAYR